jgi:hypothetical protein
VSAEQVCKGIFDQDIVDRHWCLTVNQCW